MLAMWSCANAEYKRRLRNIVTRLFILSTTLLDFWQTGALRAKHSKPLDCYSLRSRTTYCLCQSLYTWITTKSVWETFEEISHGLSEIIKNILYVLFWLTTHFKNKCTCRLVLNLAGRYSCCPGIYYVIVTCFLIMLPTRRAHQLTEDEKYGTAARNCRDELLSIDLAARFAIFTSASSTLHIKIKNEQFISGLVNKCTDL